MAPSTKDMKAPLILDGGMSRELIRLGAPFAQPEWSALSLLRAPQHVRRAHDDFLAAGADILTTNSYALVPFHIGEERFWSRGAELAGLAARLAREAADAEMARTKGRRRVLVAGSLPPVFGSYEPQRFDAGAVGKYLDVVVKAMEGYVDFWLGETFSLIAEGEAVLEATRGTGKEVWISFCPDDGVGASEREVRLRSGESVEEVAGWAVGRGKEVEALLFNCCRPEFIDGALDAAMRVMKEKSANGTETGPRLGAYANAFVPRSNEYAANEDVARTDEELTPEAYARTAMKWREQGAAIIGGCCGIGHDHMRAVAQALKQQDRT